MSGVTCSFSCTPDRLFVGSVPFRSPFYSYSHVRTTSVFTRLFSKVPELASLGRVFRSAAPVELTESETEYVVRCVKHIMDAHVVLDFTVSNTIEEQVRNACDS